MTLKHIYIVLFLILNAITLFSQTKEDSLISIRESKLFNELSKNIFSPNINDEINEIVKYYKFKNFDRSIKFIQTILTYKDVIKNDTVSMNVFSLLANLYITSNQVDLAARFLFRAYNISNKYPGSPANAWTLLEIGNLYFSIGIFDKSAEYFGKAKREFDRSLANSKSKDNIYLGLAVSLENWGLSLSEGKLYKEAIDKVKEAFQYRQKLKNPMYLQYANMNIANIFLANINNDSAIHYFRISLRFSEQNSRYEDKTQQISFKIRALNGLYRAFFLKGDLDSANYYMNNLIKFTEETNSHQQLVIGLVGNSVLFNRIGNYNIAISEGKKALNYAMKKDIKYIVNEIHSLLYHSYYKLNNIDSAFKYLNLTHEYLDQNRAKSNLKSIEQSEESEKLERNLYETEKINNEIKLNNARMKNQRYMLIAVIIFLFLVGLGIYNRFHYKNKMVKIVGKKNDELQDALDKLNAYQKELNNTNKELNESNNTKNTLFSIIAHDLKNSIGSVRSAIGYLNSEYNSLSDEEKIEFLDLSMKSSDNLYNLLENLLLWSSAQRNSIKLNLIDANLKFIVNQSIQLYQQKAKEKSINLVNNLNDDLVLKIDPNQIDTVIRNILNNAVKFTKKNGEIKIYNYQQDNEELVVIEDNGIGMPKDKADQLFKGVSNKSTYGTDGEKGTGLGLMICREFISMHNGKIWVESEEGRGTKILISFPI